jgi:hypothetical protein
MATAVPRVRPWTTIRIASEFVLAYVAVRLVVVGGPGAFPGAGTALTGPGRPRELKIVPGTGYDGQFVYRLALDPFTRSVTAHGITLDSPAYRQQRIMTALLGRMISLLPGISVGAALIVVNTAAVVAAVVAGVELAQDFGRKPIWGAVLGLPAAVPASLSLDLTEPVSWAGVLLGLLAVRRRRWAWAAAAFTLAVLARETAGVVLLAFAVASGVALIKGRGSGSFPLRWLAIPMLVEVAWQLWLWHVWGTLPLMQGLANVNVGAGQHVSTSRTGTGSSPIPLYGVGKTFLYGLATGDTSNVARGLSYLCERLALLALLGAAGWLLVTRRLRPGPVVVTAWAVAAAVALALSGWIVDVQFLRAAMEAWGLSVLLLLQYPSRWTNALLCLAGVVTGLVAVTFVATV